MRENVYKLLDMYIRYSKNPNILHLWAMPILAPQFWINYFCRGKGRFPTGVVARKWPRELMLKGVALGPKELGRPGMHCGHCFLLQYIYTFNIFRSEETDPFSFTCSFPKLSTPRNSSSSLNRASEPQASEASCTSSCIEKQTELRVLQGFNPNTL